MVQETDIIREEINETREQLSEKLAALEGRVREEVDTAKLKADETIENVKGVLRNFSPRYQIETHPLAAIGVSACAGVAVGAYAMKRRHAAPASYRVSSSVDYFVDGRGAAVRLPPGERERYPSRPSLWSRFSSYFGEEIHLVRGLVLAAVADKVASLVKEPMPNIAPQVDEVVRSVKRKVGIKEGELS